MEINQNQQQIVHYQIPNYYQNDYQIMMGARDLDYKSPLWEDQVYIVTRCRFSKVGSRYRALKLDILGQVSLES